MSTKRKEAERKIILECIEIYRSLPALWDIKSKEYSNRIKKSEAYEQLLCKYREYYPDADKSHLLKKFNSLRTNFRKELNRIKKSKKRGAGTDEIIEPTLWYFDEMKFLVGHNVWPHEDGDNETEDDINDANISGKTNTSTLTHNNGSAKYKARKIDETRELISLARRHLQERQNDFDKIGLAWAVELQKMTPQQQIFAKKAINDIVFEGQMGTLQRDSVKINSFTRTSSPCTPYTMQPSPVYFDTPHSPPQPTPIMPIDDCGDTALVNFKSSKSNS